MSGTPGDAHIWTITTDPVPLAECGYTPEVVDITDEKRTGYTEPDEEGNREPIYETVVIGQQVQHAVATGVTCQACIDAATPVEPNPED